MTPKPEENIIEDKETLEEESFTPDGGLKLSSGFKASPRVRDAKVKNPMLWLEDKRIDDDIGDLWRVHDKLYDMTEFIGKHPGGKFWLEMTRGTDITESFVTTHANPSVVQVLEKYYVKEASKPRVSPITFKEDGFYMTFKRKAWEILKDTGTGPTLDSYLIQDGLLAFFIFFWILGSCLVSYVTIIISSVFLALAACCSHNFFHMKDNWRMYIFDLLTVSSRDWRVSHVLSHHNFPNTIYDYEVLAFEPFFETLPKKNKTFLQRFGSVVPGFIMFFIAFFMEAVNRYILIFQGKLQYHWTNFIVLAELLIMCVLSRSVVSGFLMWVVLHLCASFGFLIIGLTAAHHHPDIYHEGDVFLKDKDYGIFIVIATRDRGIVMSNLFLTAILFGQHTLHHLFPTVDHSKLPLLLPVFLETCKEFGVSFEFKTTWQLFKGFFEQVANIEPNKNLNELLGFKH